MKYSLLTFCFLPALLILDSPVRAHPPESDLIAEQLSQISGILSDLNISHAQDFDSIVETTQRWRRKPDQERWEVADLSITQEQEKSVKQRLKALNFLDEYSPKSQSFDYAILLGGTAPRMTYRLQQLLKAWDRGIRFKKIILLSGQRPLEPNIDRVEELITKAIGAGKSERARNLARPNTESEAQTMIFVTTAMPEELRQLPRQTIHSSRIWLAEGRWQRGNTRDSVKAWITSHPTPGKALIVSNQPHVHYQLEVLSQELKPAGFTTDAIGEAANPNNSLIAYLDALALWLHNLQKPVSQASSSP